MSSRTSAICAIDRAAIADLKVLQRAKISEIIAALIGAGVQKLDEQADVLGLSRSTTWAILQCNHKNSGLSALVISRMLASQKLPPQVRAKILEYVEEKSLGHFGDKETALRRFRSRL